MHHNPPRSRKQSRTSPPRRGTLRLSPSRIPVAPALHPSPSLTNLSVPSHANSITPLTPVGTPVQEETLGSSASSVIDVEITGGILIQDSDHKGNTVEIDDVTITGRVEQPSVSEANKKVLRDQLRKTLSQSRPVDASSSPKNSGTTHQPASDQALPYQARSYFVLTEAGKPVFTQTDGQGVDNTASLIGVMQALISVFLDDNDKLRCINAGKMRITFLMRTPLYYVCASSWGEPESVVRIHHASTRSHLEYLHLQILSIVTAAQLRRIFERRNNFDLRRLLDGAESFLSSLLDRAQLDLSMTMSSLHCLKVEKNLRKRIADALVPHSKMKDILYVMLVVAGQVVALIRPKKHSIHPADIHIVLNTIHCPSISNSPAPDSWIPICLPKYNSQIFAHAYVSFLRRHEKPGSSSQPQIALASESGVSGENANLALDPNSRAAAIKDDLQSPNVVLICISPGANMDVIREWSNSTSQKLEDDDLVQEIVRSCQLSETIYSVSDLSIPGLRHFVYKSRTNVQITMPTFEEPYDDVDARRRLITLYQSLHDAIHAKSGQEGPLKLQYLRTEKESLLGWITQPFEIYMSLSPWLPKSAAVNAANAVSRWVKKEEGRLFLSDAPVF